MKSNKDLPIGSVIVLARKSNRYFQPSYEVMSHEGRTKLTLKDVNRGPGWDETKRKYVGIRGPGGWFRGENKAFGEEFTCHVKEIANWNIEKVTKPE